MQTVIRLGGKSIWQKLNRAQIEEAVRLILEAVGEDPNRGRPY